jgi:hypothetical protein
MENDIDEILKYLVYIHKQNRRISIVTTFKGVSYSKTVKLSSVADKDQVITVSTPPRQSLSLLPNTQIAIHSDLFPHAVLAQVYEVDNQRRTAQLYPIEYIKGSDENRSQVRVLTAGGIPVTISGEGDDQLKAYLHDISIQGASVVLEKITRENEDAIQTGKSSRLSFELQLSGESSPYAFRIPAKTIYLTRMNKGKYRVGLHTYPRPKDIAALRRYIFDRQTELFHEISGTTSRSRPSIVF